MGRRLLEDAGRVACAYVAASAVIAGVVALALAQPARDWLQFKFGFARVHSSLADAASIFRHNLPTLLELLAAAGLVQLAALTVTAGGRRAWVTACDLIGAQVLVLNAATVGAAVGAYGGRAFTALLPHGPVEVAAFAVGGSVYLHARRGRVTVREAAPAGALALGLLVIAALLEEVH